MCWESPLTGFDPVVDMGHTSSETGHISSAQSNGAPVDPLQALADIVAGAQVEKNACDLALQAVSSPLTMDCGLPGKVALQAICSSVDSWVVVEVVVSGVQPSPSDAVTVSKLAGIPWRIHRCFGQVTSPTLLSPQEFINDVAKLVPIPIVKSGDLICKPVSLPRLGRLEFIWGAVSVRFPSFSSLQRYLAEAVHV